MKWWVLVVLAVVAVAGACGGGSGWSKTDEALVRSAVAFDVKNLMTTADVDCAARIAKQHFSNIHDYDQNVGDHPTTAGRRFLNQAENECR